MTPTGRDNGLPPASRYVALVDVDPPVADHVLALLRDAGVTAVAEPYVGERDPYTRAITPRRHPTERVHVDHDRLDVARTVVAEALPSLRAEFHSGAAMVEDAEAAAAAEQHRREGDQLGSDEVDALFADIVAGWGQTGADPVPRWSVLEDAPSEPGPDDEPVADEGGRPPLSSRLVRRSDPARPPATTPDLDDEEHFVPPPPPPLPEADRVTRLAWAALVGGPTLIVVAALLGIQLEGWLAMLALASFLGGFGTLVARMRDRPRQDDGWDDGAVL